MSAVTAWLDWTIPLLITEWWLEKDQNRRVTATRVTAGDGGRRVPV